MKRHKLICATLLLGASGSLMAESPTKESPAKPLAKLMGCSSLIGINTALSYFLLKDALKLTDSQSFVNVYLTGVLTWFSYNLTLHVKKSYTTLTEPGTDKDTQ